MKALDPKGMLKCLAEQPQMLADAAKLAPSSPIAGAKDISNIVICGVGGSAIGGDVCRSILAERISLPVFVNRNCCLPKWVDTKTLVIAVSYSGETEETLLCFKEAQQKKAKLACVSSGGRLAALAQKDNLPFIMVKDGYQPRGAIPYLTVPILTFLKELGIIGDFSQGTKEAVSLLEGLRGKYKEDVPLKANFAKQIAEKLQEKIPVIMASEGCISAAATRWKCQFNENSKLTSHACFFPELTHNEVVNLAHLKKGRHQFALIILRDEADHERNKKRIEITKSLVSKSFTGTHEVWATGSDPLARIFSVMYLADYVSVYLALLSGTDPSEIDVLNRLKRELKR
ncbi:bifunctional phosphoglucose/phosphomannose isomerase [Patescibacteria group bacterium]|nr:bifunctional phosphoglucose/phosphomannose isomerase [Patescibacteria group bacterium]